MREPIPGGPGWQMNGDNLRAEITDLGEFLAAHGDDPYVGVTAALFQGDVVAARAAIDPLLTGAPGDIRLLALVWARKCERSEQMSTLSAHRNGHSGRPTLVCDLREQKPARTAHTSGRTRRDGRQAPF